MLDFWQIEQIKLTCQMAIYLQKRHLWFIFTLDNIIWNYNQFLNYFILFLYKFIYFNWRLITLQYCIGFAIHQHASTTGVHVFPSWTPLLPPSPYHPSVSSQCTSPEHPVSCIKTGLSHMVIYMFQCHSPKSSHPRALPQSPKNRSIHLCLFCCLAYRVIVMIFLNSIYMH